MIVVQDLERNAAAVTPYRFLIQMRELYPQFAQQNNTGMYMQQDAEECWSQLLYVFREQLKVGHAKAMTPKVYTFACSVCTGLSLARARFSTAHVPICLCRLCGSGACTWRVHRCGVCLYVCAGPCMLCFCVCLRMGMCPCRCVSMRKGGRRYTSPRIPSLLVPLLSLSFYTSSSVSLSLNRCVHLKSAG
jgi:hypothetical protein